MFQFVAQIAPRSGSFTMYLCFYFCWYCSRLWFDVSPFFQSHVVATEFAGRGMLHCDLIN